jgi:hypothetical protein
MRTGFLARAVVVLFLSLVPFRILSQGFLPGDDALRHAAKAASGRSWSEVLVLRHEITMDSHPGWHALLGLVHRLTAADPHALVVVAVVLTLLTLLVPPAFLLRRPEAWALAVTAFAVLEPRFIGRLASGRPFVLSAALLVGLALASSRARMEDVLRPRVLALLALLLGAVAWIHPSWHLFLLPVAACLIAGRRRLAAALTAALALGVLLAGLCYGHPLEFVQQSLLHTLLAMGSPAPPGTLAIEFLPGDGSPLLLLATAGLLLSRVARGAWTPTILTTPVFVLAGLGWLLGWLVVRFWSDWGALALLAWIALEAQSALEQWVDEHSRRRLALALVAGLAALLATGSGLRGRPASGERSYLSLTGVGVESALPDAGGILYTDDMRLFFQLFYARPTAPWRYIVGYEPALMPPDDLATFRATLAARTPGNFAPWVAKMTPADRLVLQSTEGRPLLPELQWTQVSQTVWSGRRPAPPR